MKNLIKPWPVIKAAHILTMETLEFEVVDKGDSAARRSHITLHVLCTAQLKGAPFTLYHKPKVVVLCDIRKALWVSEDFSLCNHKHGHAMKSPTCPPPISS